MTAIRTADLIQVFRAIEAAIEADKGRLCELDGNIGDADHGVSMSIGFSAVGEALAKLDPAATEPTGVFNQAAKSFLSAVGASTGPLYATALMRAGAAVKGRAEIDRDGMVEVLVAIAKGMQDRGKAERGDKTMIDAWLPAAEAASAAQARGEPLGACLDAALAAAAAGAESTVAMIAAKGRASRLGERARGHMDPGAASAVTILAAMTKAVAALP